MEERMYICEFCKIYYIPKRRFIQRFCCASCRSLYHISKKKENELSVPQNAEIINNPFKIEKMSVAGVGNAATGTLIAEGVIAVAKTFLIKEEDKPSTKKDLAQLLRSLKERYHPIKNIAPKIDGSKAYYDMQTQTYVFLKNNTPAPNGI